MSKYDDIYEVAANNYGLITRKEAHDMDISDKELSRLATDGRLIRLGYGVYRIKHHVLDELDPYAETVVLARSDAYLYGESVMALFSLCPTNPTRIFVATPRRVRRTLPKGTQIVRRPDTKDITFYEGIPSQKVSAAIRSCMDRIMTDRLETATNKALDKGLITKAEKQTLLDELELK